MTLAEIDPTSVGDESFVFGDCEDLCRHLLDLVRRGKKTATCTAMLAVENGSLAMPVVGRRDLALNWDRTPALMIETVDVEIRKFYDVDEAFALAEGENETLEGWRADHEVYFARTTGFTPDMRVICERFRVVEDYEADRCSQRAVSL